MRFFVLLLFSLCALTTNAQTLQREFPAGKNVRVEIENRFGQIRVQAAENSRPFSTESDDQTNQPSSKILLAANSPDGTVAENAIAITNAGDSLIAIVNETGKRIDLTLLIPARSQIKVAGANGAIEIDGNFESVEAATDTGTIYTNVPIDNLKYNFLWTNSRPRFLSEIELPDPQEKAGGKFELSGKFPAKTPKFKQQSSESEDRNEQSEPFAIIDNQESEEQSKTANRKTKRQEFKNKAVSLNLTTKRGVILLNIAPGDVPSDLRPRPLTNAAKAVVRSGDSILSEAIRKVSPQYFGDYLKTLPARRASPNLTLRENDKHSTANFAALRRINVNVSDKNARAVNNLGVADFTIVENGAPAEIVMVETATAPFNLVLLLDVSGSVEERIDFIRKAARDFVNTVSPNDKLAVIAFRDDVEVLSKFTTDKKFLSESLDTFDAGGGTALYDSLAYVLADTLRPLRGERTAIVILSDGDDTRSFIPFNPLLGAIEESGALVYPLYVPSGLIPANGTINPNQTADALRNRYLNLTSKAEAEARQLAEASGGAYFPIRRLEDLQQAYEDIVAQLRTAYSITYRSKTAATPRLRVTVKQPGAFVRVGSTSATAAAK